MGWARAQLIYDKLSKPPPFGSLLELMCLIVQRERAQQAVLGVRAQAQAAIGGDGAEAAFKDYVNAVNRVEVEDTKRKMHEQMENLKKIKEIRFSPIAMPSKKLKLPTFTAQDLRNTGVLSSQLRPVSDTRRPQRARKQRKTR